MQENTDQKNSEYGHFLRSVRIKGLDLTEPHSEATEDVSMVDLKDIEKNICLKKKLW